MKALVVRQPWATLIALGVKSIETRPWPPNGPMRPDGGRGLPGCTLERGERIAIVAGAAPDYEAASTLDDHLHLVGLCATDWQGRTFTPRANGFDTRSGALGAVVCTVVVDDALPIIDVEEVWTLPDEGLWLVDTTHMLGDPPLPGSGPRLLSKHVTEDGRKRVQAFTEFAAQWPLGDFTPGRWGWMLTDPEPCDPVPCKGRQGVFVLPADVAEVLT